MQQGGAAIPPLARGRAPIAAMLTQTPLVKMPPAKVPPLVPILVPAKVPLLVPILVPTKVPILVLVPAKLQSAMGLAKL